MRRKRTSTRLLRCRTRRRPWERQACIAAAASDRSAYCCGGAEESKGGDGKEEKDGDATAALPDAEAPVGAPSVHSCGGAEERNG